MNAIGITRELTRFSERHARNIARLSLIELRDSTPVLTGWAKSNWIGRVGGPGGGPFGSPERVTFGPQNGSFTAFAFYRLYKGNIYITNRVPYIDKLNAGSSTKAPAGFVEMARARALAKARASR